MLINQLPLLFSILISISIFPVLTRRKSSIDYTEIKPGQYPYLMFFDAKVSFSGVSVTGVGILVSDRTILTDGLTGEAVKNKPTFAYSAYSGKSNTTNLSLRYSIDSVGGNIFHKPSYDIEGNPYFLNYSVVAVILKDPVVFEDGFHPIQIPFYSTLEETDAVHVGLSIATGNLYHSKIRMKKWKICIQHYQSVNHLAPPQYFWPDTYRTMICTSVMPRVEDSIPPNPIVQGPFIAKGLTPKDDRLLGIHSFFYYLKNKTRIIIGPDIVLLRNHVINLSNKTLK